MFPSVVQLNSLINILNTVLATQAKNILSNPTYSLFFPLRDPDNVVLCVLAADSEVDVALQIHFTLLQSFCCDSGISILRVSGVHRLQRLLEQALVTLDANRNQEDHRDLHCILVTVSSLGQSGFVKCYCCSWLN